MKLQAFDYSENVGSHRILVRCNECGLMTLSGSFDLEGPPFRAYYCDECTAKLLTAPDCGGCPVICHEGCSKRTPTEKEN